MSTISGISIMPETAGSAAKTRLAGLRDCTPNCPPDCPDCGQQVSFKKQPKGDVYDSYAQTRKKKRNIALLTGAGVLALGAASMIGLGKLHNSQWVANLKDGWFKSGMESVTRGCDNACKFIKDGAVKLWDKVKNIGKKGN